MERPERAGRYLVFDEMAAGGTATVHLGRLTGPVGFGRTVAIKRLHPHLQKEPDFVAMLLDEARLASRIYHPNVVQMLDVVTEGGISLVLEYVHGESLAKLWRRIAKRDERVEPSIAAAIVVGALRGLHAAHELRGERGEELGLVHRDVSPQNILVDLDGTARILDFGIAKAAGRIQTTRDGAVKGKLAYMAPEQIRNQPLDRRADVYAASVVLWELLTGKRLFLCEDEGAAVAKILMEEIPPPSSVAPHVDAALDAVVMRGLARPCNERFRSAREMADALEGACTPAAPSRVAAWVARDWPAAEARKQRLAEIERDGALSEQGGAASAEEGTANAIQVAPIAAPAKARSPLWTIGIAIVALGAAAAGIVRWQMRSPSAFAGPAETAATASVTPAPATIEASPDAAAAATGATADAALAAPATSEPSASPRKKAPGVVPARPAGRLVSKTAACDPPWTLDQSGNHVWKRECFK